MPAPHMGLNFHRLRTFGENWLFFRHPQSKPADGIFLSLRYTSHHNVLKDAQEKIKHLF